MTYKLFLDDERFPVTNDFIIVRNYDDACNYVDKNGLPLFISFDHDLGKGKSGYDFAKWLVEYMLNRGMTMRFDYFVHSANPIGADNIRGLLEGFSRF